MRIVLVVINVLVILIVAITFLFPNDIVRIVLGLPFVFFLPGFALVSALYPKREWIDKVERIVLSLSLSIAIVSLIGFILSYSHWGLELHVVLYSIAFFTIVTSTIALIRLR